MIDSEFGIILGFFSFRNHYTTLFGICKVVWKIIFPNFENIFEYFFKKVLTSSVFGVIIASQEQKFDRYRYFLFRFEKYHVNNRFSILCERQI